jgi:L-phenylalanine/L-methionine N-acetyltransferase
MEIRKAKPQDALGIKQVQLNSWLETYPKFEPGVTKEIILQLPWIQRIKNGEVSSVETRIANHPISECPIVAVVNQTIVGIALPNQDNLKRNRVGALYVHPDHVGKGIGSKLMNSVLDFYTGKDVYLTVTQNNLPAISFYERFGFVKTGKEEDYELLEGVSMKLFEMVRKSV